MAPQNAHPPSLPPTVEEAYRRKCIQLKERSKEIEEENDAYRLRLSRLKRQIQKLRLERALLLDQISKRTSTNVEDSEGSPSPPPTPQDKPLRTKRGHRKPSLLPGNDGGNTLGATFISQHLTTLSPSSDGFSHAQLESQKEQSRATNGAVKPPKRPSNAFEIYCNDTRPVLQTQHKDAIAAGEFRIEEELARGWKDLAEKEKEEFQQRYERELVQWKEAKESFKQGLKDATARERSRARENRTSRGGRNRFEDAQDDEDADDDQDVEMAEAEPGADQDTDPETEVDENDGAD
ncbi:hypothetical protein GQX73_g9920 [Xylaria multiplex]|uniref:HMG box domain-containing protein n=1 Tax=Xylaria multiplex TaxID=323545 RepID=A0A7C8MIW0_9PEZI|nr:hypothetical protein GQX73_g9920 [Xylaria multiplex]